MKIEIGTSIDNLIFGLSKEEVQNQLGVPDKVYKDDYGDIYLIYFKNVIALKFEKDLNFKLGWVECRNNKSTLFGLKLIGMHQKDVLAIPEIKALGKAEKEDFGTVESFTYYEHWLEFQFELGHLTTINFGVLYNEQDEVLWP